MSKLLRLHLFALIILHVTQAVLIFGAVPNAPSGLKVTALSSKQVQLSWIDNSTDELGFKVERSLDAKTYTLVAQPPANSTSYIDGGVLVWNTYYYRVRSYNSSGLSYSTSVVSIRVTETTTTQPPTTSQPTLSNTPFQWQSATPDSQGINGSKLGIMRDVLASRHTQALLIMRNDKTIMEWYSYGNNLSTRFGLSSAAKGVVGGMSLLVALNDARLAPTDYAAKFIAAWRTDSVKSKIKISQLASHTSGIEDADGTALWMQEFWKRVPDPFTISINDAPVIFTPGSNMAYSNPGFAALGYAVTASVKGQAQSDIYSLLRQRIMRPLGIADTEWTIGYSAPSLVDGMKLYATWGGANFTARAMAKLGRLMLRQGNWNGQQLASSAWVTKELTPVDSRFSSTLCWWTNLPHAFKTPLPVDSFITAGDGHRILLVIPSLKLIVVRLGEQLMSEDDFWAGLNEYIFEPLMAAVVN
jgi:CubicO group peptidase (beta-lactamase class C family)